jgi:hypothetical protein
METKKLSQKQQALHRAIGDITKRNNGVPPTVAELKHELGVKSDQSVYKLLKKLEAAGLVSREQGKKRSIRLISSNQGVVQTPAEAASGTIAIGVSGFVMSPIQKEVFDKLREVDPKVADIYKGAIFNLFQRSDHPDWMAQVANSLRHVFAVLSRQGSGDDGTAKVSTVFDPHGGIIAAEEAVWKEWGELNQYFTKISHYSEDYETSEQEFLEKTEQLEKLLAHYILPRQIDVYEKLDRIIQEGPDSASVEELRKILRDTASYGYFFDKIDYKWFDLLADNKYLKPVFPYVVGEYIVRIASTIPDKIVDLVARYDVEYTIADHRKAIRRFFISAATQMPPEHASKIARLVAKQKWVNDAPADYDFLAHEGERLLAMLIESREYEAAKVLAQHFLRTKTSGEEERSLRDIKSYISEYEYEQIVKTLDKVPDDQSRQFIQMLVGILEVAMKAASNDDKYWYIWRSSIESPERSYRHNVAEVVIDGLVSLSSKYFGYLEREKAQISKEIDELLGKTSSYTLIRLKLYLYRTFASHCLDKVGPALIKYFDVAYVAKEYEELLEQEFNNLSETYKNQYLDLVSAGIADKDESYQRYWKIGKLVLIKGLLNATWIKEYTRLLGDEDENRFRPTHGNTSTSWVGPTSPKESKDLKNMPLDRLVDYLLEWQPPESGFGEPSRIGLARKFAEVVKENPSFYSTNAPAFFRQAMNPVYLYELFSALASVVTTKPDIDWKSILECMEWVVSNLQAGTFKDFKPDEEDFGAGWGTVLQYMASLLENGFGTSSNEIPFKFRDKVWPVLEYISDHPEPDLEYEDKYGGSNDDFYNLSINTVRGEAFHAIFAYIFWSVRHLKAPKGKNVIPPEAKKVLDEHLDTVKEPGLTIRSVYGRFFPWLYTFDPAWSKSIVDNLFPVEDLPRRYAAWETYLINAVYPGILENLRPQYERAILELKMPSLEKAGRLDPQERLIDHLMIAYAYSVIEYDDPLITLFYREANREQKGEAVSFMGRVYVMREEEGSSHRPPAKKRLMDFWSKRVEESDTVEELTEFGWWVRTDYFDDNWMLEILLKTLEKTKGIIDYNYKVLETLDVLAEAHSLLVAQCLVLIVKAKYQDRFLQMSREASVKTITERLYLHGDSQVRNLIQQVVDQMLRLGNNDFRMYATSANSLLNDSDVNEANND